MSLGTQFGIIIANLLSLLMVKSEKITLVRYEFVAYFDVAKGESVSKVCDILLTEDDLVNITLKINEINWIQAEKLSIIENGNEEVDFFMETKKKICGLFEAEPRNWKYASIVVIDNISDIKSSYAIARMPNSPIVPVIFDVKL